jgi:hypothetical protein
LQRLRERIAELEAALKAAANPNARKVKTLQIIASVIAKKHYRFNPEANRSAAVPNIRKAIELEGLSLDDETVLPRKRPS